MTKDVLVGLDQASVQVIDALCVMARHLGATVYLVGGPVRDLLMGRPLVDLDIAVEGDAMLLAKALAKANGARAVCHPAFLTATVTFTGGRTVDFVTARREIYKRPGAFPTVMKAGLKDDLFRRDFTLNAMAMELAAGRRGRVIDLYGGLKDLKAGRIRVLHDKSFVDDPTRILRAARFMARFGFRLERRTQRLLTAALQGKVLETITHNRYMKEYNKIIQEKDAKAAVDILASWGVTTH